MKKLLIILAILMPLFLQAQPWEAAKRFSAAIGSTISTVGVAASPDGSTYLTGSFQGTVTFGSMTVTSPNTGLNYGYLVKLNPAFEVEWVDTFPQKPYTLTTDNMGNVFVAGSHADTLSYVAKFNPQGQQLAFFNSTGGNSYARVVRTDAAGSCYLGSWVNSSTSFGGYSPAPVGGRDNYLVKLNPDLSQVHWAVLTGASNQLDEVYDLEIDNNGYIYTSGNYSQDWYFSCFCYRGDFYITKHNATNGAQVWQKIFNSGSGTSTQLFLSGNTDGQTLYASGSFKNTTTFAPGISLTADGGTDDYHIFAASLDASNGALNWAKKVSLTGDSYPQGMVQVDDHLLLHGYHLSTALMGTFLLTPLGNSDPFTVQVAPVNGAVDTAEAFAGASTDRGFGIDTRNGTLVVCGNTASATLPIGSFNLPGNSQSVYVARKFYKQPLILESTGIQDVSCAGGGDGSATATAQGGTAPYTYAWSNGDTTATALQLSAGIYTVTVTDTAGGQVSATVNITEPAQLTIQVLNSTPASCTGGGSIEVAASGGTAGYTYVWSNGANTAAINGLPAGMYTVSVTDTNNCISTLGIQVQGGVDTEPPQITAGNIELPLGASGSVQLSENLLSVVVTDNCGVASVTMQPTVFDCADLGPQQVTITATDASGNTATSTITVTVLDELAPTVSCPGNIVSCPNDNIVEYDAPVAIDNCLNTGGGQWSLISGLESGSAFPTGETTTVAYGYTDASGNMGSCSFEVIILSEVTIQVDGVTPDQGGQSVGSISISLSGGIPPFSYAWTKNGQSVSNAQNPIGLTKGYYDLKVTDANGCEFELLQVFVDDLVATQEPAWMSGLVIAPNPAGVYTNIRFQNLPEAELEIQVFDLSGRSIFSAFASASAAVQINCALWPAGVYSMVFRSEQEYGVRRLVVQH